MIANTYFWSIRYQHQNWYLIQQGVKTPLCIHPEESMYIPWFIWHKQVFYKPISVNTPMMTLLKEVTIPKW